MTTPHYDLAILGTGSGNSIPDDDMTGWRIAIVEPDVFGGTCLNRGCIPSKMFIHSADVAHGIATASTFGVDATFNGADWPAIRDRIFGRIDPIAEGGEAYRRGLDHIDVYDQPASFVGPKTLRSGDTTFTADQIVLAAGTRPSIPPIPGIDGVAVHTSDTIMRLDALPRHLLVIGGGAIACEMAHIFHGLGSAVTMLVRGEVLLTAEEPEIGHALTARFRERGIDVRTDCTATSAAGSADGPEGHAGVTLQTADGPISGDVLLVATGRISNADQMDLAAGGVEVDATNRPVVDEFMRTTAEGVWALGDLAGHHQDLKHIANAHARAIRHSLKHPGSPVAPHVPNQPRAVFTDPEVASVGLLEAEARAAGLEVRVAVRDYAATAYGWALEDTTSFAKVVVDASTDLILGAHIIGPMASILIQPLVQAMTFGQTATQVATEVIWPHPALSEVVEQALLAVCA